MSDTDSFIDEVTEEVKRDRLFAAMRKYGWIAVAAVLAIVGGTAYREYNIASERAAAEAFGDAIIEAVEGAGEAERQAALSEITAPNAGAQAVLDMLGAQISNPATGDAGEEGASVEDAVARLQAVANNAETPQIYRQIASYKALSLGAGVLSADERRSGFEALAVPGQPLRLLAEEQLALIEIETGDKDAALTRLQRMFADSEVTAGLRRRASQFIVALGGDLPEGA